MHRHVMWTVCDVSAVQPHLYFGLFGWGYATLIIFPNVCTLEPLLFKKGRGPGRATSIGMSCGLCVMSQQYSLTCILVCLVGDMQLLKFFPMYAHLNLSCSKRGVANGVSRAQACHVGCVMSQ